MTKIKIRKSFGNDQWRSQVPAFGGQSASVASKNGGPGAYPRKIFGGHALEMLGK